LGVAQFRAFRYEWWPSQTLTTAGLPATAGPGCDGPLCFSRPAQVRRRTAAVDKLTEKYERVPRG